MFYLDKLTYSSYILILMLDIFHMPSNQNLSFIIIISVVCLLTYNVAHHPKEYISIRIIILATYLAGIYASIDCFSIRVWQPGAYTRFFCKPQMIK